MFEMMTFPDVFFIFQNFGFLGCKGKGVVKGQKMAQNDKKFCLRRGFWYTCVK